MKKAYLPKAKNGFCFAVVGSIPCFFAMVFTALALAIIGGIAIIKFIRKTKK